VLADDLKGLAKQISEFRIESATESAGFRSRVETQIAMIKWIGVFFASMLVALFTGALTLAWNASAMNSEVKEQGRRIEQMEGDVKAIREELSVQFGKIEKKTDDILQRLDRLAQLKGNPDR
jgi:TolA-binding protein